MSNVGKLMLDNFSPESAGAVSRFVLFLRRHRLQMMLNLASPPNADSLFAALEIEERAGTDGSNNLPSSSEEVLTGCQKEIVEYHRKLQDRGRRKVEKLAAKLLAAANRVEPDEVIDRFRDIPSKCRIKIDRLHAEFDSKLTHLRGQELVDRTHQDDGEERDRNDDSGRSARKAVFFVMMLVVVGVTGLALGSNLVWGPEAGVLLSSDPAMVIAAVTVVLPFLVAIGVSNPASAQRDRDRPAFQLAMLLSMIFLGIFAVFCAHLIFVSADSPEFIATDIGAALSSMTTNPGAINADTDALKGLGVVTLMGLLGFLLGNRIISEDGESGKARAAYLRTRGKREALAVRLREQVNGIVDSAEKEVDRSAKRLQRQVKKLSGLVEQARNTQVLYDDFLAGLEESCNLVLEHYRTSNAAARSSDIPPSFSEQICFRTEGASRKLFFEEGIERHRKTASEMKEFSEAVAGVRRDLRALNRDTIRSLDGVEFHEDSDRAYAFSAAPPASG